VQEAFRQDSRLWRLNLDLYPELDPEQALARLAEAETPEQQAARRCAELRVIAQMLQVMENAWLSLNLGDLYAHPLNRGWIDVFHRWTSAETVRNHWPLLRGEFGKDFVRFCEKQMRLGEVEGRPVPLDGNQAQPHLLARLCLEFADQWPEWTAEFQGRLERASQSTPPLAWLIYPDNPYPAAQAPALEGQDQVPAGVILVSPAAEYGSETPGPTAYNFLVWMRGAYRNTGLGRSAVRAVLRQLRQRWPGSFRLRVLLPVGELTGPGGQLQKGMWLTFFYHHDFVRCSGAPGQDGGPREAEAVLERVFQPQNRGVAQ
jgi:hypothetical protein